MGLSDWPFHLASPTRSCEPPDLKAPLLPKPLCSQDCGNSKWFNYSFPRKTITGGHTRGLLLSKAAFPLGQCVCSLSSSLHLPKQLRSPFWSLMEKPSRASPLSPNSIPPSITISHTLPLALQKGTFPTHQRPRPQSQRRAKDQEERSQVALQTWQGSGSCQTSTSPLPWWCSSVPPSSDHFTCKVEGDKPSQNGQSLDFRREEKSFLGHPGQALHTFTQCRGG